jgi:hypothetical protein
MAYILPQVLVFQEFDLVPIALPDTLRAHISGAHAFMLRYSEPNEKLLAYLGMYDPLNDAISEWPQRPPGGIVDASYTKVYIDNANLQYYQRLVPSPADPTTAVTPVGNNKIRSADQEYGYAANGVNYPRFPELGDRDVQVGDRVHIRGVVGTANYDLDTYVMGIEADPTGASVAEPEFPDSNGKQQSASAVVTPTGVTNSILLTVDNSNYSALADGALDDTYNIEVTQASSGGKLETAQLRITTTSGNDDDLVVVPAAAGTSFSVGNRGLKLTFAHSNTTDDLLTTMSFSVEVKCAYAPVTADSSTSTYRGTKSTTYIIEFTRGGLVSTDHTTCPAFTVTTTLGVDSSTALPVTDLTLIYPVGTQGVKVKFGGAADGIRKGDKFTIEVVAAQDGRIAVLVLAHNLPADLVTPTPVADLDLTLYVQRNIMVDESADGFVNWEQNETQILIHGGIVAYDETFTLGGEPRPLQVMSGEVYVEYRAWLSDLASSVGTIYDVGTIDDMISGPLSPDNPLKWGVFKALSNSNGSEVKFTSVANPNEIESWVSVLELLIGRNDVYNLVPLTFDREVLDLYAAHVNDESSPEQARWRAVWGAIQAKTTEAVVSDTTSTNGLVVMAVINPNNEAFETSTENTLLTVPAGNSAFLDNQVRPGDVVRTNYGIDTSGNETYVEYVIDQVINENAVLLMSGPPDPITTPQKIEVWRYMNKDEIAQDLAMQAGSFASRRVKMVWPDVVGSGGVLQEGFYLAAALAGLRSGIVPQQGMTNLQVAGFDDLSRTTNFFGGAQLNTMAGAGTWIVTQAPDGTVYTRHALTTDNTDVNSSEEMITTNLDSISYVFANRLAPYIGLMNVTDSGLMILSTEIDSCINFLKSNGYVARLGGQLVDATVVSLQPHAILPDRVVCVIDVTLPYPLNNLEIHLVV